MVMLVAGVDLRTSMVLVVPAEMGLVFLEFMGLVVFRIHGWLLFQFAYDFETKLFIL